MDNESTQVPINITVELIAKAFEAWETDLRESPREYLTAEQCAAANISELSAVRASHLVTLLMFVAKEERDHA